MTTTNESYIGPTYDVMHDSGFRFGVVRYRDGKGGWVFTPTQPHRRPSVKAHETPHGAIPGWCRSGRLVERALADAASDYARDLTE